MKLFIAEVKKELKTRPSRTRNLNRKIGLWDKLLGRNSNRHKDPIGYLEKNPDPKILLPDDIEQAGLT